MMKFMENEYFNAFWVEEKDNNDFVRSVSQRRLSSLPDGEILIRVYYSALNYKDALSASGHKGITRRYPHTPGVDAAGFVEESSSEKFIKGDRVLVTGYDLGMNTSGGFSEYIRVPVGWVVPIPEHINFRESMIFGTSGFTAGLSIEAIRNHGIKPETGKILVTGATGGVGTLAVAMLSKAGYHVVASTGKAEQTNFLKKLGASEIISREEVNDSSQKPLLPKKWIAAIDNVGGNTLSTVIRSTHEHGLVASVGLVESFNLNMTVYPFILRGVTLAGIDSAETKMDKRLRIWSRIWNEFRLDDYEFFVKETNLYDLSEEIDLILQGKQSGKVVVKI